MFFREKITAAVVEGDSFHSVTRTEFKQRSAVETNFSHFGPTANDFHALEALFKSYGETGSGKKRYYLHNDAEATHHNKRLADMGVTCSAVPANSPLGKIPKPIPTFCSTKACMAW
ncbi:hypothetical protein [Thiothrix subterranea]|uniref:hypothetical protein n=1 Tax=Thiothrix subterranea TaxID=2735563 RepID=UPI0035AC035A